MFPVLVNLQQVVFIQLHASFSCLCRLATELGQVRLLAHARQRQLEELQTDVSRKYSEWSQDWEMQQAQAHEQRKMISDITSQVNEA